MSVLIKGMEMPTSCDSCRIMEFEDTNCVEEFYCGCPIVFKAHPQGVDHRPDYCPLIEVPEPHGDLIDRDALSKSLNRLCDRVCQYSKAQRKFMCSACPIGDTFTVVEDDAPTVIPASESKERPAFLPQYELTPRSEEG